MTRLLRFLFGPPHVHVPNVTDDGHHRCRCAHRRDLHLGSSGYCLTCSCDYYEKLETS